MGYLLLLLGVLSLSIGVLCTFKAIESTKCIAIRIITIVVAMIFICSATDLLNKAISIIMETLSI